MAGVGFSTAFPCLRKSSLRFEVPSLRPSTKRSLRIRAEVNFVNAEDAKRLVKDEGYVVLDVRDMRQFERAHIKSCHHVPLFIENLDNDLVKEKFPLDSKLLVVCQEGLRSTAAANKLEGVGFQNISCVTSGLQSVKPGTFETEGSTELENAGKGGLVTVQGKISAVLGTILICAYLFITLFPEQAEKILQMSPAS